MRCLSALSPAARRSRTPPSWTPCAAPGNARLAARELGRNRSTFTKRRATARYEESGDWCFEDEAPPPALPPLDPVTGWSKADPTKAKHDPKKALFGGWRLEDLKKRKAKG